MIGAGRIGFKLEFDKKRIKPASHYRIMKAYKAYMPDPQTKWLKTRKLKTKKLEARKGRRQLSSNRLGHLDSQPRKRAPSTS